MNGGLERLRLDPAVLAEEREHAQLHALAVHLREVALRVVERLGKGLIAHPRLHDLGAVGVFYDARLLGARAHRFGQLGGPPVGVHIDHGSLPENGVRLDLKNTKN
jgi:hypothetical protein